MENNVNLDKKQIKNKHAKQTDRKYQGDIKSNTNSALSTQEPERDSETLIKTFKNLSLDKIQGEQDIKIENEKPLSTSQKSTSIAADTESVISNELLSHKNVKWEELKVNSKISSVLRSNGFNFPSPSQNLSLPPIISGQDVLVRSKNGSGKTLSFLIPILQKIDPSKNTLQAIIMVPIRELALQIAKVARVLCKDLNIKSTPLVGGSDLSNDILRVSSGVHLLIGTPGRILDVLERNLCTIENNAIVVLDEADKLLDTIFYESIYRLLAVLPKKRQLCLFSATFPVSTKSFVSNHMKDPKLILVSNEYTLHNISLFYAKVSLDTKLPCLKSLLASLDFNQCIIYCNKINNVQNLAEKITEMGYSCYFIHSNMSQDERNAVFHNFLKNKCKILVSTDLTTRGTDVKGVNLVINFDLPNSSESFLHRHGRAGRFGVKGCCISLIYNSETENLQNYAKFVDKTALPCSDSSFKDFCKK